MSSNHEVHQTPTIDFELLITRENEKRPRITTEPIRREESVVRSLHSTKKEMLEWQEELANNIIESMHSVDPQIVNRHNFGGSNERGPIDFILDRFRSDISMLRNYSDSNLGYFPTSLHDNWRRFNCVASLSLYASQIRGFDPESTKIVVEEGNLEDDESTRLERTLSEAAQIRDVLLPALDAYEEKFNNFTSAVEKLVPGILSRKSYCCNFIGSYGQSELDYVITPGNQCVVDRINQYYDAVLLEHLYAHYDGNNDVIAYSHRKLGWTTFEIDLDSESELGMVLKSNFGYGSSSYFMSLLRYKGINAINAPFLIFYSGVRKAEFAGYTYSYEIREESFCACFENAVELYYEYRKIGEGAFVDKYFRKALSDLSDLLAIVVQTETFLEITTLERFGDLTTGGCNELIPDEGFSQIAFELSKRANEEVDSIAEAIWVSRRAGDDDIADAKTRVNMIVSDSAGHERTAKLQKLVTADLVRNKLIVNLGLRSDSHAEVKDLIDRIIPAEPGMYTKTFEGFELIDVRITKAESVISFIDRIKKIAEAVRFDNILSSTQKSCRAISEQGMNYYTETIEPKLSAAIPKRDQANAALKELDMKIDSLQKSNSDISWLKKQRESTCRTLSELNTEISKLTSQKNRIQNFEKELGVFS